MNADDFARASISFGTPSMRMRRDDAKTESNIARELYDRIRRDSRYTLEPYRSVKLVAEIMKRDPLDVLRAIGFEKVMADYDEGVVR
jgi:hypothetical protein